MKWIIAPILTLTLIAACSHKHMEKKETADTAMIEAKPLMTDAEIANAIMTTNTEEMNMAQVAKKNAEKQEVRNFANMMFKEHAANNDKALALAKKNDLLPREDMESMEMKSEAEEKIEKMKTIKGADFDRMYMDEQITMHQDVLGKIDSEYIPNAQNEELRAMLQETRGRVEMHLKNAEDIRESL